MSGTVEILGERYRYRFLTRRELKEIVSKSGEDQMLFEEEVCRTCVMEYPPDFPGLDTCLAGIPTELSQTILSSSGYTEDATLLEKRALEWARSPQARLDVLICFCFPKWSLDDLDDMDANTYYKYAAASQLIIGGVYGMDASTFLDPSRDGRPSSPQPRNQHAIR